MHAYGMQLYMYSKPSLYETTHVVMEWHAVLQTLPVSFSYKISLAHKYVISIHICERLNSWKLVLLIYISYI